MYRDKVSSRSVAPLDLKAAMPADGRSSHTGRAYRGRCPVWQTAQADFAERIGTGVGPTPAQQVGLEPRPSRALPSFGRCHAGVHLGHHSRWNRSDKNGRILDDACGCSTNAYRRTDLYARRHPGQSNTVSAAIRAAVRCPAKSTAAAAGAIASDDGPTRASVGIGIEERLDGGGATAKFGQSRGYRWRPGASLFAL